MSEEDKMDFRDFERKIVGISLLNRIEGLEPEDVAQELRLAVWKKSKKYDPKRGSKETFFNKIVRSTLINLYRKSKRKKREINNNVIPL